jgi:hypothetical protein
VRSTVPTSLDGLDFSGVELLTARDEIMTAKKYLSYLALILAIMVVGGCTMAKISGRGTVPLMMNQPQTKIETIQQVKTSKTIAFDYTSAFDVSEVLSDILIDTKADAIVNLVITIKTTPLNLLLNIVTFGIADAKTFEISGQAVKAPGGLGYIPALGTETVAESGDLGELLPLVMAEEPGDGSANMILRVGEGGGSYRLVRYTPRNGPE